MFIQIALLAAQMILGEVTRQRPKRTSFKDFVDNNEPSEVRPIPYVGGTIELTPTRQWYGDYLQRAVERDSHWTDYLFLGALSFLLDTITVGYRSYIGEMFPLCYGPDTHVERITIDDRPVFQATVGTDNAGGGFLIDDPQAWGGDQPPGGGGEYAWCDLTRGNYSDHANAYLESLLSDPPNKTPSLRGVSALVKRGPSGFTESGYFFAGGIGAIPKLKLWKITVRRQPDNLATGFNKIGRHMNPMEVIYEWSTSLDYGARVPLEELNLDSWRSIAEDLYTEGTGWSGRIESTTSPQAVIDDVLAQIDGILDPSPSLGLTARLIRRDYSFGSLRVLNRDNITRVERFTPGTYEDTKNVTRVEFPDQDNNFKPRPAQYIDPANQQIQSRLVPETKSFLGVADAEQANVIATRDGRAISLPRAPLECFVFPSFGRLTYRGEVVLFEWSSPSFSIVMRVLAITPNGPSETDYRLVLIEDQFATGLRTFGEPVGTAHDDPGAGLDTAPPSATWNTTDFPPNGLTLSLLLDNTNQFIPVIEGGIIFGSYAPGGQYARLYITEPGGVQTLSPVRLVPDANNEATFKWPANAEGNYEFCFQTYSLRGVTNGVKVCADIDIGAIGSPSLSPSASVSPSPSPSISPSASESPSVSPSVSPSASESPSASASVSPSVSPSSSESLSPSPSSSLSPSASISPSASVSPSSSISPSASQSPSSSASPSSGFGFTRAVTIDHTKVPNTDQTDFPVLISGTFAYLKTVANGGNVENSSGFDIIFTSDQFGTNQLAHEIESYNAATGTVIFWVKVPTVATASDTVFYIQYGNASISTSQENKTGVWSNNFAFVAHHHGTDPVESDSSPNNHTSNNPGNTTPVTGQIDGGIDINDGTNSNILSYAEISDSLSPTAAVTMSLWFKRQGGIGNNQIVVNKGNGTTNPGSSYEFAFNTSNQLRFEVNDGSAWKTATYSTAISDTTTWHHAFGTFDGSNVKIYVDGSLRTTTAFSGSINNSTTALHYGSASNGTLRYDGNLDEVRIATVARSADWYTTEWNNQSSPSTFFSIGAEL